MFCQINMLEVCISASNENLTSSMNRNLSVSVIVPVLNGEATIGDLLTALINQTAVPSHPEIMVVDNGSTDSTVDIVRQFDVRLLHASTLGPGAARNCGLYEAHGEIVAYLDADTLPTRRWLAEIVAPFSDPAVILVGGRTFSYKPTTPAERFIARQLETFAFEYSVSRSLFPFVASRNLAVRREMALAIGGWAEDMPTAEDMDFCYRIQRSYATDIVRQPTAILFHRDPTSDEALRRQAWTYGQGLAHMYLRYPQVARWDFVKSWQLLRILIIRATRPLGLRLNQRWQPIATADIELADYHWFWTQWFWRGFFSMMTHKQRSEPSQLRHRSPRNLEEI
jgi:glycosyltransferase involved in cell wall biosynthesis